MTKKPFRASVQRLVVMLAAAAILAGVSVGVAQTRPSNRAERFGKALTIGQMAPDLELPILVFKSNDKGERFGVVTDKKVRLSSFRGRKTVVLWFSSYT